MWNENYYYKIIIKKNYRLLKIVKILFKESFYNFRFLDHPVE